MSLDESCSQHSVIVCAVSSNEVSLITLKLEVTQSMSPRALVDCGASKNFVQIQSFNKRELEYVEREIPLTRMSVRLATGTSITVMKRVVGITYTLKGVQYNDDFTYWTWMTNLMLFLDCRGSEGTIHRSAGIDKQSICLSLVRQMAI